MRQAALLLCVLCVLATAAGHLPAAEPMPPGSPRECWLKTPTVSVMTGFIYEPLKPYTIQQWMENLGGKFDADQWVKDFKEAGATHLVFYDKWIDGLVFHDTRTTNFKTRKDFLRELAPACQRGHLPLVIYFNAISDGNPEFDPWATLDRQGKPIVFSPNWPTRYQTLYSPYRQKAVEQVRELLTNYGPIHGLWHDIFSERLNTSSPWVAQGYQKMFGEPFEKASGARLAEFNHRTLAGWLDEIDAIRRQQKQDACVFTANGSGGDFLCSGQWTDLVGSRLQYLFTEGHSFAANDQWARMAWVLPKPLDINLLLNSSWFAPMEDAAPPSHLSNKQAIAATAIAVCQGAGVNWALTPGHSGVFGQDLQRAKAAGAWFARVKPWLENAQPYADVGIVLGTPAAGGPGLPPSDFLWKNARLPGAWQRATALGDALARHGTFSRLLYMTAYGGSWPASLKEFRAILVPDLALLDAAHLDQVRQYVREGGRLIAFAHASLLDEQARRRQEYGLGDVLGIRVAGEVTFAAASPRGAIRVDSQYNEEYAPHVLAGAPGEAWASNGTPMPHWVEVTLPEPIDVARVELINRAGPYQITDFEIEVPDADQWKSIKTVHNATGREMPVNLTPAVKTQKIRVKILKELYQGQDRQYADLAALRVLDTKGKEWVSSRPVRIGLTLDDPEISRAFAGEGPQWPPIAVRVEPTTAKPLAGLQMAGHAPAILCNRFGEGRAYFFATTDACLPGQDAFWAGVARLAAGEPTLTVSPQDAERYRIILTRAAGSHVLHLIDSRAGQGGAKAPKVTVSLLPARLGGFQQAIEVGGAAPLPLSREGERVSITVQPDPVASVVLK